MAARDTAAFAEFAAARSPALLRSAYLMVGDHGLAQDLVQEALAKTYVAWPQLREVGAVEAYTRKALTTTYISWWRRKAWRSERPHDDVPDQADQSPWHGEEVVTRAWMWEVLQSLPPRQRSAIVLWYYEDLSEAQTAEAMGCAVGTVKSQVAAGLKKLRDQLGEDVDLLVTSERAVGR